MAEEHVHLAGFAHWRDAKGKVFAPCGALIVSGASGRPSQAASEDLTLVTCPVCRQQVGALGRAYSAARRGKKIEW